MFEREQNILDAIRLIRSFRGVIMLEETDD